MVVKSLSHSLEPTDQANSKATADWAARTTQSATLFSLRFPDDQYSDSCELAVKVP